MIASTGIEMMKKIANVDASYGMSPEELKAKVALSDALIVRSATKVNLMITGSRTPVFRSWLRTTLSASSVQAASSLLV